MGRTKKQTLTVIATSSCRADTVEGREFSITSSNTFMGTCVASETFFARVNASTHLLSADQEISSLVLGNINVEERRKISNVDGSCNDLRNPLKSDKLDSTADQADKLSPKASATLELLGTDIKWLSQQARSQKIVESKSRDEQSRLLPNFPAHDQFLGCLHCATHG